MYVLRRIVAVQLGFLVIRVQWYESMTLPHSRSPPLEPVKCAQFLFRLPTSPTRPPCLTVRLQPAILRY
jgi:hypothetical protein